MSEEKLCSHVYTVDLHGIPCRCMKCGELWIPNPPQPSWYESLDYSKEIDATANNMSDEKDKEVALDQSNAIYMLKGISTLMDGLIAGSVLTTPKLAMPELKERLDRAIALLEGK